MLTTRSTFEGYARLDGVLNSIPPLPPNPQIGSNPRNLQSAVIGSSDTRPLGPSPLPAFPPCSTQSGH